MRSIAYELIECVSRVARLLFRFVFGSQLNGALDFACSQFGHVTFSSRSFFFGGPTAAYYDSYAAAAATSRRTEVKDDRGEPEYRRYDDAKENASRARHR